MIASGASVVLVFLVLLVLCGCFEVDVGVVLYQRTAGRHVPAQVWWCYLGVCIHALLDTSRNLSAELIHGM